MKKRMPCDYQCRLCDFKGKDRHHYYRHMKREHPDNDDKTIVVVNNASTELDITPIDDFRRFVIEDNDVQISIRAKTLEGKRRLERMLSTSAPGGIMQVLRQLDSNNDEYLENTITSLLSMVHSQPDVPQLHSVCLSDIARRSVSFYSRSESDDCRWIVHPQESSMHILTQHARDLFSCILQAGLAALIIQVWKGTEIILTMNTGDRILVLRYDREFDNICVRTDRYDREFFTECPESRSAEVAELLKLIENRKEQVLQAVKRAIPKRERIRFFLDYGRPICYPTLQASN